jgi:hypothetical protein
MYQFKVVIVRPKSIDDFPSAEEVINPLGAEGWDLVNCQIPDTKGGGWRLVYTFKRKM